MTDSITIARGGILARPAGRIRRWRRQLSDRVRADGDDFARSLGWPVTMVTGRTGFGRLIYRDARFGQRRAAPRPYLDQLTELAGRPPDMLRRPGPPGPETLPPAGRWGRQKS